MKAVELVSFLAKAMKTLSKAGIRMDDCRHLQVWREYSALVADREKKTYIIALLAHRHGLSERTVRRIITRFERDV